MEKWKTGKSQIMLDHFIASNNTLTIATMTAITQPTAQQQGFMCKFGPGCCFHSPLSNVSCQSFSYKEICPGGLSNLTNCLIATFIIILDFFLGGGGNNTQQPMCKAVEMNRESQKNIEWNIDVHAPPSKMWTARRRKCIIATSSNATSLTICHIHGAGDSNASKGGWS